MTILTKVLMGLHRLVLLLTSWAVRCVRFLASLFEPAQPPTELPLTILTPFPFFATSKGVPVTGTQSEGTDYKQSLSSLVLIINNSSRNR